MRKHTPKKTLWSGTKWGREKSLIDGGIEINGGAVNASL
jgi:hypothetical protein